MAAAQAAPNAGPSAASSSAELQSLIGALSDRLAKMRASPDPNARATVPAILEEFRAMEQILVQSEHDAGMSAAEHATNARLLQSVRSALNGDAPRSTSGDVQLAPLTMNGGADHRVDVKPENGHANGHANGANGHANGADAKDAKPADGKDGKAGDKKDEKKAPPPKMPFFSLFRFATRTDRIMLYIAVFASICVGAAMPINSIVFGELINTIGYNTDTDHLVDDIIYYIRYVGIICVVTLVCGFLEVTFFVITSERQTAALRLALLRSIISQPVGWHDTQNAGALTSRMNDTSLVQDAISDKVGTLIQFNTQFLIGLLVGFIYGWQLTLVILAVMPLMMIAGGMMGTFMQQIAIKTQAAYAGAGAVADETILNPRTVQAFGAEERETARYAKSLEVAMAQGIRNGIVGGTSLGFMFLVMFGSYGLALWYGAQLVREHTYNGRQDYTGGDVTTVFLSVMMGSQALGQMAPQITVIAQGQAAAWWVFQVVDRISPINVFSDAGKKLNAKALANAAQVDATAAPTPKSAVAGRIEFQDVHFTYDTNPTKPILRGLNLTINPGEKIALVGASGCGKSTVISLLERFYDPKQGSVKIDGVDLKELNVRWWREQVGLVSQEPVLFAATVRENLLYGKPTATDAEIVAAARAANCHDFINALPDGYNTMVGDKGKLLSGGQKQRIAIARGLLKNPPLLLLDEATSALDAANEKDVQLALNVLMGGRTTIIIAHRLSTIRDVDRIFVIANGQVLESGNHNELMVLNGAYARLVEAQEQKKNAPADTKEEAEAKAKKESILALQAAYLRKSSQAMADQKADAAGAEMKGVEKKNGNGHGNGKDAKADDKDKPVEDDAPPVSMWRMVKLTAPNWPYFAWGIVGAAAFGAVFPLFSFLLSGMITIFYETDPDKMKRDAANYSLYFLAMAVGIMVMIFSMQWAFGVLAERLTLLIRTESYRAIMRQNIGFFDEKKNLSGILVTRLSQDAAQVQNATNRQLATFVQMIVMVATGLAIAFSYGWKLSLVILSVSPLIIFGGNFQFRGQFGFNQKSKAEFEIANRVAAEAISNVRTVVSFTGETQLVTRFERMLETMVDVGTRSALVQGVAFGFANAIVFAVYCLSFWYGSTLIKSGEMTFEQYLKVYFAISMTATSIGRSSSYAPDYVKARKATYNIFALLDRTPAIDTWNKTGAVADFKEGGVEIKDLHFEYPTRPDVKVFSGLNLRVAPKTTVALVGASGCGKSTIIQLLQRFYDPVKGAIEVDGKDLRQLQLPTLRAKIGIVSQEPVLFTGTVRENICYGYPNATDAEVVEAARSANIHDFIMTLKDGYNTPLGSKGVQLSGGEKQRVAIARAIIRRPTILLLDEATSALDSKSEREVQAAIDRVMVGRTTIVVAHRLSTIRNAHQIVVLEHGAIKEMGAHDDLLSRNGLYASLWALSSLERDPNK